MTLSDARLFDEASAILRRGFDAEASALAEIEAQRAAMEGGA